MPIYDYTVSANGKRQVEIIIDDSLIVRQLAKSGYDICIFEVDGDVKVEINKDVHSFNLDKDLLFINDSKYIEFITKYITIQLEIMEQNEKSDLHNI